MADLTDAAIDAALERGRAAHAGEPRAAAARYDRASGRVIVDLTNGCAFAFPPRLAQGLDTASDDQLAAVEILGRGYGLHLGGTGRRSFPAGPDGGPLRDEGMDGPPRRPGHVGGQGRRIPRQRSQGRPSAQDGQPGGAMMEKLAELFDENAELPEPPKPARGARRGRKVAERPGVRDRIFGLAAH